MRHLLFFLAGLAAFVFLIGGMARPIPPTKGELLLTVYHIALYRCYQAPDEERRDHWCRKADQKLGELRARGIPHLKALDIR